MLKACLLFAVVVILVGDWAAGKWAKDTNPWWLLLAFPSWTLGCALYLPVIRAVGVAKALTGATIAAAVGAFVIGAVAGDAVGPGQVLGLVLGVVALYLLAHP